MKAITFSYAVMLLMCVFAGFIRALVCEYSVGWGFLILCVLAWSVVPFRELRRKVPHYPDFSTVLFVVSFAVLVILVTSTTLLMMKMKTFLSVMCLTSSWLALLMTVWFISFIPREPKQATEWNSCESKKVDMYFCAGFFSLELFLFYFCFFLS